MRIGLGLSPNIRRRPGVPYTGAPVNIVPPAVTGTETQGETLTASDGTWIGAEPITLSKQWARAVTLDGEVVTVTSDPASEPYWVNISGETANTHDLDGDDVGEKLLCIVTATNSEGSAYRWSNITGAVAAAPADELLLETGDVLLLESGDSLLLEAA